MGLRANAPRSVDLRQQGLEGPMKDQAQVGVCWAFALSTIMENAARRQGRQEVVAPLHLVATDAFEDLWVRGKTHGPMTLEATWPYDAPKACKLKSKPEPWCEDAYKVKQGSWREDPVLVGEVERANRNGVVAGTKIEKLVRSFDAIADVLGQGQSAYVSFAIDSQSWHRPAGGILNDYAQADRGNHAVVAVGYRLDGPRGRELLIHNSWGADWADGGYAWVSENTLSQHGLEAFVVEVTVSGSPQGQLPGFGLPLPPGFPPIPGLGSSQGGGAGAPPAGCAAGQVSDVLTGACSAPCANGRAPAGGACLPF